jgi:hypothetical protein
MAFSLDQRVDDNIVPGSFSVETNEKLRALDAFRQGWIYEGLRMMRIDIKGDLPGLFNRRVAEYFGNPFQFKEDVRKVAADLAKAGL